MAVKKKGKLSGGAGKAEAKRDPNLLMSANQIWMAGLGALSRTQEGGTKVFDELVRITRPGGHLVLSVRARGMEEAGFPAAIARLEATKRWRHVETVGPFQAMRSEPESLYVVHVCRKTG